MQEASRFWCRDVQKRRSFKVRQGLLIFFRFNARVRDADRQYEQNNNCELDNGVYNKFIMEEQKNDSLVEIPPYEKSELQEIENMI